MTTNHSGEPTPLPHWWMQCRKATFAEHVAECATPTDSSDPAHTTNPATPAEDSADELVCPLCGQAIQDGDRRVSWFSKTGGEVDERGASHLVCPDTIPYATEEGVVVAVDLDGTVHRQKPVRPPWIDPRGCFGHCDPEGWHVPCADPALENRSQ